ncbi:PHA/PHB synthase family protein [Actibacterium sp.]|uniref:PHA/PHB synthase family protein n=1 Tax=Actibacterium sp. TaxID=1872125 RepID=UPI003561CF39
MVEKKNDPLTSFDPFAFMSQWVKVSQKAQKVLTESLTSTKVPGSVIPPSSLLAWGQFWQGVAKDPNQFFSILSEGEVTKREPRDRRFKHEAWEDNPALKAILEGYLTSADRLRSLVQGADHLSRGDKRRVNFLAEQFIDAMAPTNFWATNPDVIAKISETGGLNLVEGFINFVDDVNQGAGHVRSADPDAFEFGVTIAGSKGSVIFQNDLMQLIQFEPTTKKVDSVPLLIVPPWVNKYYLFDLREKSSFIRWCVEQGLTVFAISWVNPHDKLGEKDFENYWTEGVMSAIDAILETTGEKNVNLFSFCLGGTLTAAGLAHAAALGDERIKSATLIGTMTEFSDLGDFEVFLDPEQIKLMKQHTADKGHVSSGDMAQLFSLLRANDLIWSAAVSRYLLANDPLASDLLYWFSDGIGMPAKMLETFGQKVMLENALSKPGGISFAGTPIDLSKVTTPLLFISMKADHVATWETTYRGAKQFPGEKRFILGGSGHNAGVINPPAAGKHGYWTNDDFPETSEDWLANAVQHEGSWWPEWRRWLEGFGGEKVAARPAAKGRLPVLEAAPGSYAREGR